MVWDTGDLILILPHQISMANAAVVLQAPCVWAGARLHFLSIACPLYLTGKKRVWWCNKNTPGLQQCGETAIV